MSKYEDRQAVADKVEWEGGVVEALEYGIRVEHLPEDDTELVQAWRALQDGWNSFQRLVEAAQELLDGAA